MEEGIRRRLNTDSPKARMYNLLLKDKAIDSIKECDSFLVLIIRKDKTGECHSVINGIDDALLIADGFTEFCKHFNPENYKGEEQ